MRDFRKYEVWKDSHNLVLKIFKITKSFPKEENYGITSQIRRSSQSIPTNIAEGCGRMSDIDFKRFLYTSLGSVFELDYQIELCKDVKYINHDQYVILQEDIIKIRRKLIALIKKLSAQST